MTIRLPARARVSLAAMLAVAATSAVFGVIAILIGDILFWPGVVLIVYAVAIAADERMERRAQLAELREQERRRQVRERATIELHAFNAGVQARKVRHR